MSLLILVAAYASPPSFLSLSPALSFIQLLVKMPNLHAFFRRRICDLEVKE